MIVDAEDPIENMKCEQRRLILPSVLFGGGGVIFWVGIYNTRPHKGSIVHQILENHSSSLLGIPHLPLPPLFPDLNPTEGMWDALKRRLFNHCLPMSSAVL